MVRGNSSGGGQSSLGYLFGGGPEPARPAPANAPPASAPPAQNTETPAEPRQKPAPPLVKPNDTPAGFVARNMNNYQRSEGQNTGNFITDRPTTKVHAAPGGGSSLNYLFGGSGK
ncbi:hypothetical protein AMTRI_Chr09g35300 [Amborella trichopoda]|uniref:Protein SPIRAL1-like 1 n=1 Tax=Amborella trichopoda TaxID=13333 RepID=W1NM86_AMBTC|nr:protein SPIRAL1-like 1 [Amborella trichopoda]XP_011628953.1 protein SPIRAL1-like 1 [Amborella trichopoda]ERM96345.1 hypothetical protein AMTR_s00001p00214730 [Amborella trichopoda]|eukprot:XP_006828929.1 protein SPIRAL1-like 1 [Amborella trichopoda]